MFRNVLFVLSFLATPLFARDLGSRPIVLVHGWGPEFLSQLTKLKQHLVDSGVSSSIILLTSYNGNDSPDQITADISAELDAFLGNFPVGTHYDVISHSLGGFVGLYAPLQTHWGSQMEKFTALAGVAHGQNALPKSCVLAKGCGETMPLMIIPSAFLDSFYWEEGETLMAIKKCSLYSPDDHAVDNPLNSGGFPDGKNIEVQGVRHVQFMNDLDVFHIMASTCYDDPPPPGGFTHEWTSH